MSRSAWKTTWVVVADGAKALVLVNDGTDNNPVLRVISKSELDNPPSHEQGTDRAGRMPGPTGARRSAVETTDWHEFEKSEFVHRLAERLNHAAQGGRFDRMVLVAPSSVLGELRSALHVRARERLVGEVRRDLTKQPVSEIERHIVTALAREPSP